MMPKVIAALFQSLVTFLIKNRSIFTVSTGMHCR